MRNGGKLVGTGAHFSLAGDGCPYTQSSSSAQSSSMPHSSTYTLTPTPSSGSNNISLLLDRLLWICSFRRATMRSSASGVGFGGSSLIGSQPTGGDPGGEIKKFFSIAGGRRYCSSAMAEKLSNRGFGAARYTRNMVCGLMSEKDQYCVECDQKK